MTNAWDNIKAKLGGGLLTAAINASANLIAGWIDESQVTPEDIAEGALAGRNLILEGIAQVPASSLNWVRTTFRSVGTEFNREQISHGRKWHPYMAILQRDVLARDHPDHVAVIMHFLPWYRRQMDEVHAYIFDIYKEEGE